MMRDLRIAPESIYSAAIGFLFACGTWMIRPYGVNALDVIVFPTAAVAGYRLYRSDRFPPWLVPLVLSLAVGMLHSTTLPLTGATTARTAALGILGYWIWREGSLTPLGVGLITGFVLQALPLPFVMFESRVSGIAPTVSMLGMVGFTSFVLFSIHNRSIPWYLSLVGVITMAASGARAPAIGAVSFELLRYRRAKYIVLIVGLFVVVAFSQGNLHRIFDKDNLNEAREVRLASALIQNGMDDATFEARYQYLAERAAGKGVLIDDRMPRPIFERVFGVGINSHHSTIGWPRPHNVFTLAWREMGVFVLIPVMLLVIAIKRRILGLGLIVSLGIYGALDDSLFSVSGHYAIAAIVLVEAMARRKRYAT